MFRMTQYAAFIKIINMMSHELSGGISAINYKTYAIMYTKSILVTVADVHCNITLVNYKT